MTAPHRHRQGTTTTKRRKAHGAAVEYPAGYFTELMRADGGWPPRFESRGSWVSTRHAAPHVISAQSRGTDGFSAHGIDLPGARQHVENYRAHAARESKA